MPGRAENARPGIGVTVELAIRVYNLRSMPETNLWHFRELVLDLRDDAPPGWGEERLRAALIGEGIAGAIGYWPGHLPHH